MSLPRIFDYDHHQTFLAEWFEARKKKRSGYSHAVFAREAGLGNRAALLQVIQGQITFSQALLAGFTLAIGLEGPEAEYLGVFAEIDQLERQEARQRRRVEATRETVRDRRRSGAAVERKLRTRLMAHEDALEETRAQLSRARSRRRVLKLLHGPPSLDEDSPTVLKAWHYAAISELSRCAGFTRDPDLIRQALHGEVSREEVELALAELAAKGELADQPAEAGPVRPDILVTNPDVTIAFTEAYYRGMMALADASMARLLNPSENAYNQRCRLGMLTVAVQPDALAEVRALFDAFREQLHDALERAEGPPKEVVQVLFHLFPLSDGLVPVTETPDEA
ncbi:MAG: DUF4423 domain-containing protein [Alphaproteobacteria bacterium]|nr:DUF4423 domain-containing protein [Alphaproteobacteria bacterium]